MIISSCVYNGKKKIPASYASTACLYENARAVDYDPNLTVYQLLSAHHEGESYYLDQRLFGLYMLLLKHVKNPDLCTWLQENKAYFAQVPPWFEKVYVSYLICGSVVEKSKLFLTFEVIHESSDQIQETMITVAQQLKIEGEKKGAKKVAKNLLELGVSIEKILKATGLDKTTLKSL